MRMTRRGCVVAFLLVCVVGGPAVGGTMDPVEVATLGAGVVGNVAVVGNYVFAAAQSGLSIFDVSDPSSPFLTAALDTPGAANDVVIADHYAYVTVHGAGLLIFDIFDPRQPVQVGALGSLGYANRIALSGGYAYVSNINERIWVIDISDPSDPVVAASYEPPVLWQDCLDIAIVGSYAYIGVAERSLVIADVSDPTSPTTVGVCDLPDLPWGVYVSGNYAYLACSDAGLVIVDISDPSAPMQVGSFPIGPMAYRIAGAGELIYVVESPYGSVSLTQVLHAISIADPLSPGEIARYETPKLMNDIAIVGDRAYVGADAEGLMVLDLAARPLVALGAYDDPGSVYSVSLSEHSAYAHDYLNIYALDLSTPEAPRVLGRIRHKEWLYKIAAYGDYAFALPEDEGLRVIDFSDPAQPEVVFVSYTGDGHMLSDIAISGATAYLADMDALRVLDISDPRAPGEVGTCLGRYSALSIAGTLLYAADTEYLYVIDVSEASAPMVVAQVPLPPGRAPLQSATRGDRLYLLGQRGEVLIFSLSDPTHPSLMGQFAPPEDWADGFGVSGCYVYLSHAGSLHVVDMSDQTAPQEIGSYVPWGWGAGVAVRGDDIFFGDRGRGLIVLQSSVPFYDLPSTHWAYAQIMACHEAGIVGGYPDGAYHGENPVTRAEMAVFMARALAGGEGYVPTGPATPSFTDVWLSQWAYRYIEYVHAEGVVEGYWDGTYRPGLPVNRAQMAAFTARAMAGGEENVPDDPDGTPFFSDVPGDHWAYKHVEYCHDQGIVSGYWDGYHPDEVVNRAQMAAFVQRAFELAM